MAGESADAGRGRAQTDAARLREFLRDDREVLGF
jgi:hypothetical protein